MLSRVFRGKFIAGLRRAYALGTLAFPGDLQPLAADQAFRAFLRPLFRKDWVVYAKPPFGGPEHVMQYLARYTHRVAISNHRIVNVADGTVTFRWKDYAHGSQSRLMTVSADEFLRRFFLHVLPRGFVRIRFCGFLASRRRSLDLPICRRVLASCAPTTPAVDQPQPSTGWRCPGCGGLMRVIERLTAPQICARALIEGIVFDTS